MKRKTILYIGLGILAAYFLKKEIEKNAVEKYKSENNGQFSEKLDEIKTKVFALLENVHYKYKSDTMTVNDINNYEKLINNYIVK